MGNSAIEERPLSKREVGGSIPSRRIKASSTSGRKLTQITGYVTLGNPMNQERVKASRKAWKQANKDKVKAHAAAWYQRHKDRVLERTGIRDAAHPNRRKEWKAANPDRVKAYNKKYEIDHPESAIGRRVRRKTRKSGSLSPGLFAKLISYQRGLCACCKEPLGDDFHADHILPLALGGAHSDENIQLLRAKCNLEKSAKHPVDFMQSRGFLL